MASICTPAYLAQLLRAAWPSGTMEGARTDERPALHPDSPGYCYLAGVADQYQKQVGQRLGVCPGRGRVEALLTDRPAFKYNGSLQMTISRPPGVKRDHHVIHLQRVAQNVSAMTIDEVLNAAPFQSVFGADAVPSVTPALVATNPRPSSVPDPLVRRFMVCVSTLGYTAHPSSTCINLAAVSVVKKWTRYFPLVKARSLVLTLVPLPKASLCLAQLNIGWADSDVTQWAYDDDPDKTTGQGLPNLQIATVGPPAAGGTPNSLVQPCPFGGDLTRQLKPAADFGDFPWLYIRISCSPLAGNSLQEYVGAKGKPNETGYQPATPSDKLYEVWCEFELDAHTDQPLG